MHPANDVVIGMANGAQRFPPSFADSPYSYAFALSSLSAVTFVSFAMIIGYAMENRVDRDMRRAVGDRQWHPNCNKWTLWTYYKLVMSGFFLTVIFGAAPDVLTMFFWGEASDDTMNALFHFDRIMDGMVAVPFFASVAIATACHQAMGHRLSFDKKTEGLLSANRDGGDGRFRVRGVNWLGVREKAKVVGMAILVSLAVTVYKALYA
jgi:hypothetical protein